MLGEARGDRGLVSESEPSPRKMPGFGEAERSEGVAGWVAGAECRANPLRVPI